MNFEKLLNPSPEPGPVRPGRLDLSADLRDAALAIERVLSVAHENGSTDAVAILQTVSALLREIAGD